MSDDSSEEKCQRPAKRRSKCRDFRATADQFDRLYFNENSVYSDRDFEKLFRMQRKFFARFEQAISGKGEFKFRSRDATGRSSANLQILCIICDPITLARINWNGHRQILVDFRSCRFENTDHKPCLLEFSDLHCNGFKLLLCLAYPFGHLISFWLHFPVWENWKGRTPSSKMLQLSDQYQFLDVGWHSCMLALSFCTQYHCRLVLRP